MRARMRFEAWHGMVSLGAPSSLRSARTHGTGDVRLALQRALGAAQQHFAGAVSRTGSAPGGPFAALASEWCTKGGVQCAAESVADALQAVLDAPAGVPLRHHSLAALGTAGLLLLCFQLYQGRFDSLRAGVGAAALRLHLVLGHDPWLQDWQRQHVTGPDATRQQLLLDAHPFAGETYLKLGMQLAW